MRILFTIMLVTLAIGSYLLLNQPEQPKQQLNQPQVKQDELSRMAARKHIDSLTPAPEQAIGIEQADHFVSKDQLLKIPEAKVTAEAGTENVDSDNATSFAVQLDSIGSRSDNQDRVVSANQLPQADQIRLKELLDNPDSDADTLFYIHGVTGNDTQGLWGIIQNGLIHTFAKGIKLEESLIAADIPRSADERMANSSSSFLGTILDKKVKDTYVYNYQKGILGQNPDLINPGQELIIVTFTTEELINIYNHFAGQ